MHFIINLNVKNIYNSIADKLILKKNNFNAKKLKQKIYPKKRFFLFFKEKNNMPK